MRLERRGIGRCRIYLRMVRIIAYKRRMIVCSCNAIREADIRQAARCGAPDAERAYRSLGCEFQCGCCRDFAEELVEEERAKLLHTDRHAA